MSFALGNAIAEYLDEKQHIERSNPDLHAGWYKKTDFMLRAVINGEESGYEGRFDIGDGKGTGGGSLIDHIRDRADGIIKSDQYPYNQDSYKAEAQHTLDVLVPFLEKHSELTIEEQQILADFKAQNPIRTEVEQEKFEQAHGTFEIYQMKSGEQYHFNRFESLGRNKDADLTMADYNLVYSGDLSDFPAVGTLDAIYTKFNTDHPDDFSGHSLSMSDIIVTEIDGERKAFYCDTVGFTEYPDFFRKKELVQEQAQKPTVADLAVGDIILFDGSRREVEAISADSIKLRDLDAPDYGGILLSTSDVYSFDGWQEQMNEKGFEILSKAEPKEEAKDLGPVTMRKVGDFYEMYGKNAEIGAEVLGLQLFTKHGEPMVGFPDHVKSEYADKLRDAGYTVLEEQAFEINPPKREEEKLVSLQDVVDKYFGTDCESAETENGTWKLSIAEGDKVGELFYTGDAVCGIYNRGDHMEIEPYRELTTFPKLLQAAMLEHNPDKPVEIAEFQRTFDTPLDKAKFLINEFCEAEYRDGADFSDLHNVSLAYTTLTDDELPIQVTADLIDHTISYDFDGEVFSVERYDSIEDMIENGLTGLDFTELVSIPESVIEKHIGKDEPEQAVPEEAADIDAPLFADADVINQIQKDEHSDVPFWEKPDIEGEQLSLFGDPEPVRSTRTEKPKPEFAAGPIVDGVQVYESLAAEIDRGTGFVNGKLRVQEFYDEQHSTVQQLADFLKKEYGTGGHSGEGKISLVSTDSKGMTFDFSNGEKYRHSWFNVAVMTESRLRDNTYLSAEQKAEMDARKTAKASPSIVEVGDRFRHKITGDISEVISLTGALPFYSDDCTITTDKGSYATTENISYDKLLNSGLYEYIGKAEPEKAQPTPEKSEPANEVVPETEKPEIPAVKNLSQLKKAIQPGMMFEITDHSRPECIGERRIVTGVTTVDFTSKKLDENGEPIGKDLHMDFDRAKNWSFDGGEMTSHLEDGSVLMSFHFIDSLEREKPAPIKAEHTPVYTGEWLILDNKALFREIVAENERFAAKAKEVIGNGRNPADSVKALVDEFGMERTAFLTALNIVAHPGDGRFYPVDKKWACKMLAPYIDVKPDEVISRDPEKQRLFEHMIGGAPLYSIHNTHLAQFAETLIPEYEKYLVQTRSAEKDAPESTLSPVGSKSDENAAPDLFVGDHVEYKGKEYQVESIEQGGFITLCEAGREDMPHIMSRVTFLTDEFLSSGDYTVIAAKTADVPEKGDNFTITDDSLGEGGVKAKFRANVDAIRTLKTLEREKRPATAEEKETLSKYVGWGSLAKAFDKNDPKWAAEYQELSALLSPEEYRQARASVNDAFYTSPTIIDGIYEALGNFGFDGGAVLEPAMGIGNFFGRMPSEMQENSQLYGVEIDSISGRIAKALYPDADIAIQGFEKNSFQNGCFDVAVGNVPFGELGFRDTVHDTTKLHDFFFAEALDKLKNGGIMAFVTSAGTLDKRDESTRQMLADKADFIGAIRLPGGKNGAFKDNAGTEVTTDIIFLKKHDSKSVAEMTDIPDWVHIGETADGLPINKYFEQHPDMVLGTVVEGNKLYGSGTMVVAEDGFDLKTALHDAVSKLSAQISPEKGREVYAKTSEGVQVQIPSNLRNYSFFMSDDQVFFKKNNAACEFRFDKGTSQHKRFKAFIELRDLTRELIEAMELNKSDSVIANLQAKLNTAYDDFYKKYGLIHSQTNKRYFSEDVSYNLVAGLEKAYDKTKLLEKSDIFTKRTIMPPKAVDHVDTALEALTLSIAEKARVDFEYMSGLTGMTEDELKHELTGEIFKVPHTENGYQTASEYLSGDIRAKLREAEEIAEYDPDFNINVSALKQAMPEPLKAGDIDVKIGATWLDPKYYEQFMYELLQTPAYQRSDSPSARWNKKAIVGVEFSAHANAFHVSNKNSDRSVLATQKYGSHKMNAYDIFEHILNLQEPKVYKTIEVPDGLGDTKEKRVVDVDATRVVQRKADDIRKAFKAWIFKDPQRREAIVERYNELFNSVRPREYDGSSLSFPMMTADIHLHDHQKNAIAHAMFGGNTLFAHCVGAGKSATRS